MCVRTAKNVMTIYGIVLIVILLVGSYFDTNKRGLSISDVPVLALAFVGTLGMAIFAYRYLRCPRCGKAIKRTDYRKMKCSYCGEEF